ncbi:MAG: hypothetical protein V1492_03635 [Candidatus Micrarchaeota archaeon]
MKGQSSAEFLITIGVVLAFTIPVIFLLFSINQLGYEDTTLAQADAAARTLAETINSVYGQGPGASRVILLNTPPSTQFITISQLGEISVVIRTSKGEYAGTAPTFAQIEGTESIITINQSGLQLINVTNKNYKVQVQPIVGAVSG